MTLTMSKHKSRKYGRWIIIFMLCSTWIMSAFAPQASANQGVFYIGGKLTDGKQDPLKVELNSHGEVTAYLWQQVHGTTQYQRQHFSTMATNLFLSESDTTTRYYTPTAGGENMQGVVHQLLGEGTLSQPYADTLETTWALDQGNVELKLKIHYAGNESYYEKQWTIHNKSSDKTYSNLRLIHGGDTLFGGEDSARSYWDPLLNMVYLINSNMNQFGVMGFAGKNTSPADRYFGGHYGVGIQAASQGNLPNTVEANYADAGYHLQWNRASLAPHETWVIESTETWTPAGVLQVIAPPSQTTAPNSTVSYLFKLQNFQAVDDQFEVQAVSAHGYQTDIREGAIIDAAKDGAIKNVTVDVVIPPGAAGSDTITLHAVSKSDSAIKNSASVTTIIDQNIPVITKVTPLPAQVSKGIPQIVTVGINTANAPDGAKVQVELLDANKSSLPQTVTGEDVIAVNQAAVPLSIPGELECGDYYIQVKVEGINGVHSNASLKVVDEVNADLRQLSIAEGVLSPVFAREITEYEASVSHDVYHVTVTADVYDSRSTLFINGALVQSGTSSAPIPVKVGQNAIKVEVLAHDGITRKAYTILVRSAPSHEAKLLHMAVAPSRLKPHFSSEITEYSMQVDYRIEQLSVTDLVYSPSASLTVTGATYQPLTNGYIAPLQVGKNMILLMVTAQDGSTQTMYRLEVIRKQKESGGYPGPILELPNQEEPKPVVIEHEPYIRGYKDGTFRPEKGITRAELASVLWRLIKEDLGHASLKQQASFMDVPFHHWAYEAIEELKARGIMKGMDKNHFEPDRPLSRAEFAVTAARWMKLASSGEAAYPDVKGHWAAKEIAALAEAGAMEGYDNGAFRPNANVSRAEIVKMLNRLLKRGPLLEVAEPTWTDVPTSYWAFGDIEEASRTHKAQIAPQEGERFIP